VSQATANQTIGSVLVVGGGVGGVQASLDLADAGYRVFLVEEKPSIGGLMAQLDKTFPTNDCSMCILAPKLVDAGNHPNIEILTNSELLALGGEPGHLRATVRRHARFVDAERCTGCGRCMEACLVHNRPQILPIPSAAESVDPADRAAVEEILDIHGAEPKSLIPILQAVNDRWQYLPREILALLAERLGVSLPQVYHVATFYTAFRLEPRGRHLIRVCMGTACHVRGAGRVLDEFRRRLQIEAGGTTPDRLFTLETVNCLGACALGPVVLVNEEYHSLTPDRVGRLLDRLADTEGRSEN
jgi:NADH:ubiquinone oxidoreductase subunit E/NAD-dependent dihydropyrimidine dehydrogenase PreA subunit